MDSPESHSGSRDEGSDTDVSTPSPMEELDAPFQPRFSVKVTEPVKDGGVLSYNVKSNEASSGREFNVVRQYEDFEYLHLCLITCSNNYGIIVPPMPPKPVIEARDVTSKSKKQLGPRSKTLIGDDFDKDCRSLETFLKHVIAHPILGTSRPMEAFLKEKQSPERVKLKKGLFGKLSSVVDEARKANHRDVDDYFQKERNWASDHTKYNKALSETFNKVLYSEQRISAAYAHLSTALNLGGAYKDKCSMDANKVLVRFSEALEDAKHGCDVDAVNDENTLGFHFDLAARNSEALKEMLFQRTCLMVSYEESNRQLEKAKPQKRAEAEENKLAAERVFEECSDVARREIQHFKQQRIITFQNALVLYAEAKVKTARDTYALLAKSLLCFQQMQL